MDKLSLTLPPPFSDTLEMTPETIPDPIPETIPDPIPEPIIETVSLETPVELAVQLLSNTDTFIKLTPDQLHILQVILANSPSSLTDLNNCLNLIIKDGKIDASDIPLFMKIVREVYMVCHQNKAIKVATIATTLAPILKYTICILLKKNDLATPNLVDCCNALIDTSVQMIQLQSSLKPKKWAFKLC